MENQIDAGLTVMHNIKSTQSFDVIDMLPKSESNTYEILDETPKSDNKNQNFGSFDVLAQDDDLPILDDDSDKSQNGQNVVEQQYALSEYSFKKTEVETLLARLKKAGMCTKDKKDIKCLENHLQKLNDSEKNGVSFFTFNEMMETNTKNDKKMNPYLKKLYKS
jgi:hypothetical protein